MEGLQSRTPIVATIKVIRFDEEWIKNGSTKGKFTGDSTR